MKQKQKTKRNPFKTGLYKYVVTKLDNQNKINNSFVLTTNKIDHKVMNKRLLLMMKN